MIWFLLRRVLLMVPTFFGVTLITFALLMASPRDPVAANVNLNVSGEQLSAEAVKATREYLGLNQPWYVQYAGHIQRIVTLDLGTRWKDKRPIKEIIGEALPITLLLSVVSLALGYLVAIPAGVYSAVKQHSWQDQAITVLLFVLYSMPVYWVGTMLLVFLAKGDGALFPTTGIASFEGWEQMGFFQRVGDVTYHAVLPIITLTYSGFAAVSRYQRTAMLETIRQDYIRTARAKGLSERLVILRHAFRNSLIPIITLLGLSLPTLVSGAVITEQIFNIRGMGLIALEAVQYPDYPVVMTVVSYTAILTMVGVLLSDVLYALVDPRITLSEDRA